MLLCQIPVIQLATISSTHPPPAGRRRPDGLFSRRRSSPKDGWKTSVSAEGPSYEPVKGQFLSPRPDKPLESAGDFDGNKIHNSSSSFGQLASDSTAVANRWESALAWFSLWESLASITGRMPVTERLDESGPSHPASLCIRYARCAAHSSSYNLSSAFLHVYSAAWHTSGYLV